MGNSNCCITVQPDELAVIEKLGSFSQVAEPGMSCLGCDLGGICIKAHKVDTRVFEVHANTEVIVNEMILNVKTSAQLSVDQSKAFEAVYGLFQPRAVIASYISDIVRGIYCNRRMFRPGQERLKEMIKDALNDAIGKYGYLVHAVQVGSFYPTDTPQWVVDAAQAKAEAQKHLLAMREHAQGRKNYDIFQAQAARDCMILQAEGLVKQQAALADGLKRDLGADAPLSQDDLKELLLITRHFDSLEKMAQEDTTIMMPIDLGNLSRLCKEIRSFSFAPVSPPIQNGM